MRIFYNLLFILLVLFYLPYFIFTRRYRYGLSDRFGIVSKRLKIFAKDKKLIWIHAVSVGEMRSAGMLAPLLRKEFPGHTLIFSSITHTGNRIARTIATPDEFLFYLPFDLSFITDRFVKLLSPRLFITLESEFWPNLICSLNRFGIPIILVNGRISKRSYSGYKRVRFLIRPLLNKFSFFCMQSEMDKERIVELGAKRISVECTGNLKFDLPFLGTGDENYRATFRSSLGVRGDDILFVCGSTHRGEEAIILRIFRDLCRDWQNLKLLIAPRHIERVEEVTRLIIRFGFEPIRVSQLTVNSSQPTYKVFILDIMGELCSIYSASDIVFVGGSLVKKGGHNPIEPAVVSKPIIFGRWMFNFQDIAGSFIENSGAILVNNEQEFFLKLEFLLKSPEARKTLGLNASQTVKKNMGSAEKTIGIIKNIFR